MRTLLAILFVVSGTTVSFAWKCGDSPCPQGVCVKCNPSSGPCDDYCANDFVAPQNIVIQERGGAAAKLRESVGGYTPK
jgi:hypothetical protein